MEKFPTPNQNVENKPDQEKERRVEMIEAEIAAEKMEARVEILERHRILYFQCFEEGSFEKTVMGSDKLPADLKEKIRDEISFDDAEWTLRSLGWEGNKKDDFHAVNAIENFRKLPNPDDFSGIIVGGSPHMVSEQAGWMKELQGYVRAASEKKIPILGICFGHQLVAKSFGGEISTTEKREIGTVQVDLTEEGARDMLFADMPQNDLDVQMSHSEVVSGLPEDGVSLAFNSHNLNQALRVGENVRGVQFHPEIAREVLEAVSLLRENALREEGIDAKQVIEKLKNLGVSKQVLRNFDKYFVWKYAKGKK